MPQVVIENPVLNSPFREPDRHFRFAKEGITNEIAEGRRISSYFVPIAKPRGTAKGGPKLIETEWTEDRVEENKDVNRIRERVRLWREGGHAGVTQVTRRLLAYWTAPERERRLFFCQIEAVETAIYLTEVASKYGDAWIANTLREHNEAKNGGLARSAFKMATGSGKTVVMAMLIAWQALNKFANRQDARFTDTFLVVTPGITIRDRLRVLLPANPENYYRERDVCTSEDRAELLRAKILITNFHAFLLHDRGEAAKLTKSILARGKPSAFIESYDQMVRRVCRGLGNKKNIVVLNDEAHHCYRRKADAADETLSREERSEAEKRDKDARVWISGLEAIDKKIGIKAVYDLSATPFFLRGSGYPEGTLFPWVVSDFSLIDAIEAGIVKVPRVPVEDNASPGETPTYRDLWLRIRESLPKKGRNALEATDDPILPPELEGALESLYRNYEKYRRIYESNAEAKAKGQTPPVFIVVCNNTAVSKLVYDHIAGWEETKKDGTKRLKAGKLPLFSNVRDGTWAPRPNTILVDSEQLESGEAMSPEFKAIAAGEIETFRNEFRERTGRDADELTDADVLREVMNTVGKAGKLGEHVSCVVSVSMLTEGWDANTVTHVLGVRAFGTQLLCEQVVGRALRRMSYPVGLDVFPAEYAEIYGVPFSFIPTSGSQPNPTPGPIPTRVRAIQDRQSAEITFPRVMGYRYDVPTERLDCRFTAESRKTLTTKELPTETENAPIAGEPSIHNLDDLKQKRMSEVAFAVAKATLDGYFKDNDGNERPWLFPQLLAITRRWIAECLVCGDDTFPQLLLFSGPKRDAADRIHRAIATSPSTTRTLKPILRPYDTVGSTATVDFDTTRAVWATDAAKCQVSHVVADTKSWEQKVAHSLQDMDEVRRYVKNQNLGFTIPYVLDGEERQYVPDFLVDLDDGHGQDDLLHLILEVTGEKKKDKVAKADTASHLWVPAINNHGGYGRWAFFEARDPWDLKNELRDALRSGLLAVNAGTSVPAGA